MKTAQQYAEAIIQSVEDHLTNGTTGDNKTLWAEVYDLGLEHEVEEILQTLSLAEMEIALAEMEGR